MDKINNILEELKLKKLSEEKQFEQMREFVKNEEYYNSCIDEEVEWKSWEALMMGDNSIDEAEKLDEGNVVTFEKKAYPKEGWAVIMAGGAGSGKGFAIGKLVLIDAKILDVDHLKKMYNIKTGEKFNLRNPDDVAALHQIIDAKGWKEKILNMFFNARNRLNNIIFDITGKSLTSLQNYVGMTSELGYKISVVWVVTNREVAMVRNLLRDRIVPQQHFHQIHNQVKDTMFNFLKDPWFSKLVDEAWVVFSGPATAEIEKHANVTVRDEVLKNRAFKLFKKGNSFTTFTTLKGKTVDLETKIIDWLGPQESDYEKPVIYKSFDQTEKEISALKRDKKHDYWSKEGRPEGGQKLDLKQTSAW